MNDKEETRSTLSNRQLSSIPYLLASKSLEEGCRQAKVAKNTVYGWLNDETFQKELKRQREKIVEGALENLKSNITQATETLVKLLASNRETIQIRAAENIIEFTLKATEFEKLEERIQSLEERISEQQGRWR